MVEYIYYHNINPHRFEAEVSCIHAKTWCFVFLSCLSFISCLVAAVEAANMVARNVNSATKSKAVHLLRTHWRPDAVAEKSRCSRSIAYPWEQRLRMFGAPSNPYRLRNGRPRSIPRATIENLLQYHLANPWMYQDELAMFLEEEWGISVDRSTISRLLKREGINRKKGELIGPQSQQLRTAWRADMMNFTTEHLIFLDESIFKLQTGWRGMAYGPIGDPVRWSEDLRRGDTWSICEAYTIDGYLPYTGVRQGYYNTEAFIAWLTDELLPHCNAFPMPRSVICLDNINIHINPRIRQAIEEQGCLIRYLPPYSPDFNPIELTFSMLKAWLRKHFRSLRARFDGNFGGLLKYAIAESGYNRKAREHFRHSGNGTYRFEGDYEAFRRELKAWAEEHSG